MSTSPTPAFDVAAFRARLDEQAAQELLRFVAVGSVDDGKSTLIGRLLHDTDGAYTDQIEAIAARSKDGTIDFALLTDGLKAEREQGITIDVAYRYFSTPRRKFIIADTPGHVQYTRNMVTGASTADVAIILIDARLGVLQQTRRHAYIASMLGISRLVVAVNKMDLVDYDEAAYRTIVEEMKAFAASLHFKELRPIPISAVAGDNVVQKSDRTSWYEGPALLEFLETCPIDTVSDAGPLRFPVQSVLRPNLDYRAFAGSVVRGAVEPGDAIRVLPSGRTSKVRAIDTWEGELDQAFAPMAVALRLEDEIDISRGDMIVPADDPSISARRRFEAHLVWMSDRPLDPGKTYLIKHTTRTVPANIEVVVSCLNVNTLAQEPASTIELNDIALVRWVVHRPLFTDPYPTCRETGAFIVLDSLSNLTVGAGMIAETSGLTQDEGDAALLERSRVSSTERTERFGHAGVLVCLQGPVGSGRQALAWALERAAFDAGHNPLVLSSRQGVSTGDPSIAAMVESALAAGLLTIVVEEEPAADARAALRAGTNENRWVVDCRTSEGVRQARIAAGEAVGSPDEGEWTWGEPGDTTLRLEEETPEAAATRILAQLRERGLLRSSRIAD